MLLPLAVSFFPRTGNAFIDALPYFGGALIVLALFALLRSRRRRMANQVSARDRVEQYRQEKGVRNDLESLMVEIEQLAKRMSAQLDAKAVHLERLIREADDRLARLERAPDTPPAAPPPVATTSASPPVDPLTRSVHELADQGLSPVDIARKLDEHVGKVELILALRNA